MNKKVITILLLFIIIIIGLVYNYVFNSEHRDIASEKATLSYSAQELVYEFQNNEAKATVNILDKVVEVNGKITEVEDLQMVIDQSVQVTFDKSEFLEDVNQGKIITIKGRCVGYDDLLEMVKIDQATLTK